MSRKALLGSEDDLSDEESERSASGEESGSGSGSGAEEALDYDFIDHSTGTWTLHI